MKFDGYNLDSFRVSFGEMPENLNNMTSGELAGRTAIAVTFGGLASEASGGDFSDGAVTSLMIYLYNELGAYWDSKQTTWIYYDNDSQESARTSWRAQIDGAYDQVGGGIADGWHSHPAVGVPFLAPLKPLTKLFGGLFKGSKKGLGANPFQGKTPQQIDKMFRDKGFDVKGGDPVAGKGSYINPKTGRGYHIDSAHAPSKGPHVGVHRPRGAIRDKLKPRDYPLE